MKLTLKDLFAIHAMQGILERGNGAIDPGTLSEQAYEIANAMWSERERLTEKQRFNDSSITLDVSAFVDIVSSSENTPEMVSTKEWPR